MIKALPLQDFETWKSSEQLACLAKRYIWWKPVAQAMENPEQIVAQVMNMGEWSDVCRLVDLVGDEGLCRSSSMRKSVCSTNALGITGTIG
jgi:hypothetical protein